MKTNPYMVLGIGRKASPEDVKQAHRKLVRIYHPDKPGGDKDKFDEVQKAFDLLSDPDKRREYDKKSDEKPITKLSQAVRETVDEFWKSITQTDNPPIS